MPNYKLTFFLLAIFALSCSKEDESIGIDPSYVVDINYEFDSVGSLTEQTAEEAKKTINGKWNVSQNPSSGKRNVNINLIGIEFTDDRYAIVFEVSGINPETEQELNEEVIAYGPYTFTENAQGVVETVDLFETVNGVDEKIASLVNVVVQETADQLNATFDIEFDLPDDFVDFPIGNISGEYSASKEEPLISEKDASGNTNFAKIVGFVWTLDKIEIDGEELNPAEEFINEEEICSDIYNDIFQPIEDKYRPQFDALGLEFAATIEALDEVNRSFSDQINELIIQLEALNASYVPIRDAWITWSSETQYTLRDAIEATYNQSTADTEAAFAAGTITDEEYASKINEIQQIYNTDVDALIEEYSRLEEEHNVAQEQWLADSTEIESQMNTLAVEQEQLNYSEEYQRIQTDYDTQLEALNIQFDQELEASANEANSECDQARESFIANAEVRIEVSFSSYGTYLFSVSDANGGTIEVETNEWRFLDDQQTSLIVDNETELRIDGLNETQLVILEDVDEVDEETGERDQFTAKWSFVKSN